MSELPGEWPVDRPIQHLDAALGPFESPGDWQQKHGADQEERLGEAGYRLTSRLGMIQTFLQDYDLTPEEAIDCLRYEMRRYEEQNE